MSWVSERLGRVGPRRAAVTSRPKPAVRALWGLVLLLSAGWLLGGSPAWADVTGSFGVRISFAPIPCQSVLIQQSPPTVLGDQPCESTVFKIDFTTDLNVNVLVSGFLVGVHSHAGVTGFEDAILTLAATLGALEVTDLFVFAQPFGLFLAPDGQLLLVCYENAPGSGLCDTFFVGKRVEVRLSLGGVTLSNLVLLEDVNFPDCTVHDLDGDGLPDCAFKPAGGIYTTQSQSFGFGDVITLTGQTPSGITLLFQTSLCAQTPSLTIKQHAFPFSVNPHCVAGAQTPSPKPPIFFDFEIVQIENIPLAPFVTAEFAAFCTGTLACSFTSGLTVSNPMVFSRVSVSLTFSTIGGPFVFDALVVEMSSAPLTITLRFNGLLELVEVHGVAAFTLNPDTNPAHLSASLTGGPGVGITDLTIALGVERGGLLLTASGTFVGVAGTVQFSELTVGAEATAGVLRIGADLGLTPAGIAEAALTFGMTF